MDSYANGILPVFGWAASLVDGVIDIYLDGIHVGEAEYGLNRLDVYEAIPWLRDSDIGFRFRARLSRIGRRSPHPPRGDAIRRRTAFSDRTPVYRRRPRCPDLPQPHAGSGQSAGTRRQSRPPCLAGSSAARSPAIVQPLCGRVAAVPGASGQRASAEVRAACRRSRHGSRKAVFAPDYGAIRRVLESRRVRRLGGPYFPGTCSHRVDLYGGAAIYRGLANFTKGQRYAVPELHPRMGKRMSKDVFLQALKYHRDLGSTVSYAPISRRFANPMEQPRIPWMRS